jgi:hypothetical protein
MPRGGEFSDGPTVQSDNPIEAGENKIAGADVYSSPFTSNPPTIPFLSHKMGLQLTCVFVYSQVAPPKSTAPAKPPLYLRESKR